MKAAVFESFGGPIEIQNVPDPAPDPDGVVIQVQANGICRSDWHGWMGHDPDIHLPHVPGHELAGVVRDVGREVRHWKPGDRVTVPFAVGCGDCPRCLAGNQHICDHYFQPGFTAWGSFAQYVAIRYADTNLVRLPDEMDYVESASLGCRFITAFRAVVFQGRIRPGEWMAVHGCGGLGLSAIMIAAAMGANPIGLDIRDDALMFAKTIGATHVVNVRQEPDAIQLVHTLTGGGADVSLDALGSPETCRNSIRSLRKRGRHIQVGLMLAAEREAVVPMSAVVAQELEIIGSHGMQAHAYGPMLKMILAHKLNPRALVRKTVSLEQAPAELAAMGDFGGVGVTIIDRF